LVGVEALPRLAAKIDAGSDGEDDEQAKKKR